MKDVTVEKKTVLAKLIENRKNHRNIFLEAVDGYRKQAIEILEQHISDIKKGKVHQVFVSLPKPEDHTRDYDRAIAMFEMEIKDTIEMDERTFSQFVMDDWGWKQQFLTANAAYSPSAKMMMAEN